jgi:hypothetical protein
MLRAAKTNPAGFWATVVILTGSTVLLLAHLGTYALWDDESLTAMTAGSVWRAGDTSAWVDDHNLLAYNNGLLIKGFFDRYSPPLQFYFLAPFEGLLGKTAFICRLPFALCGLLTLCLILRWMWRANPPPMVWWMTAIIILTDTEFFLFNRQCRYYALAMLFSVAIAYCYNKWINRRGSILPLMLSMSGLLVSHYLDYAAVVACVTADYVIWGRHRRIPTALDCVKLIVPQLLVGAVVLSIWNPAARSAAVAAAGHTAILSPAEYASTVVPFASLRWFHDYYILIRWNWRDMLQSNFFILPLLLVCPLLYLRNKNSWLLRAPLAVVIFIAIVALLTTHPIRHRSDAEIRYLTPLLPLGIGLGIVTVSAIATLRTPLRLALLTLAVIPIFIAAPVSGESAWQSATAIRFYHELLHPQREPYTPVAQWINTRTAPGATIYVEPGYMTYPLMFHAGRAMYAWQLPNPPKPEYAKVNDALIRGKIAPDYLIAFGPYTRTMEDARSELAARGIRYERVDTIHVFWHDVFRPEIINRAFATVTPKPGEEVYIYKRLPGPATANVTTAQTR